MQGVVPGHVTQNARSPLLSPVHTARLGLFRSGFVKSGCQGLCTVLGE